MKVTIFLTLLCLTATGGAYGATKTAKPVAVTAVGGVAPATMAPPATLTQDLEEISRLVPTKMIFKLITRYLLNDAEFQAVVRALNSYDAFMVRMRVRLQPEVMMFQNWVRQQLMLSGGSMELDESMELDIFNMSPYWANTVYGWQGFMNELLSYYPQQLIRAHVDMKVTQSPIFAQFWQRVQALKPVYERVLAYPETQRLIANLTAAGADVNQLDQFIRTEFNWLNLPVAGAPVGTAPGTAAAVGQAAPAPAAAQAPFAG